MILLLIYYYYYYYYYYYFQFCLTGPFFHCQLGLNRVTKSQKENLLEDILRDFFIDYRTRITMSKATNRNNKSRTVRPAVHSIASFHAASAPLPEQSRPSMS